MEGGFGSYTLEVAAKYRLDTQVVPITLEKGVVGKVAKEMTLLKSLLEELENCLDTITENYK